MKLQNTAQRWTSRTVMSALLLLSCAHLVRAQQSTPQQLNNLRNQVNQAAPANSAPSPAQTKPAAPATSKAPQAKPVTANSPQAKAPTATATTATTASKPAPKSPVKSSANSPANPSQAKAPSAPAAPQTKAAAVKPSPAPPVKTAQTKPAGPAPASASSAPVPKAAQKAQATSPVKAVPAVANAAVPVEVKPAVEHINVSRRDPFDPLVEKKAGVAGPQSPLPAGKPGLVVATLRVDGVVRQPEGMIAIVSNPQMRVYFLREGDHLFDGVVEHITMEGVSFHENGKDAFGKAMEREVTKRLYPISGEQQ